MNGEVFIVWGGNWDLAQDVSKELADNNYAVQVGGEDNNPENSKFFLGDEVMGQLRRASRTIILAQAPVGDSNTLLFRPNLTWEWGYLSARLMPAYIHVFLIDIDRANIFSDLGGAWSTKIEIEDNKVMAKNIVTQFLTQVRQASLRPLDSLRNWPQWKEWIKNQKDGTTAPDYLMLSSALIHSIQPAFYSGEINILHSLAEKIDIPFKVSPELPDAKRICVAACLFYEYTDNRTPKINELKRVEMALVNSLDEEITNGDLYYWMNAIRNDFRGLAQKQMSYLAKPGIQETKNKTKALESFADALNDLEKISGYSKAILSLWKGYVLRNIGRIQAELGDSNKAKTALNEALNKRRESFGLLQGSRVQPIFISQILLEISAVEIDLVEYDYEPDNTVLDDAINVLKGYRKNTGIFGIWNRAIQQAEYACEKSKRNDLLKEIRLLKGYDT
jgi:tetratricopeptide (TPR) repeat protein